MKQCETCSWLETYMDENGITQHHCTYFRFNVSLDTKCNHWKEKE